MLYLPRVDAGLAGLVALLEEAGDVGDVGAEEIHEGVADLGHA